MSPSPRFPNITVYVELEGIYHATLNVALEGSCAPTIRVVTSADRIDWPTPDPDTQPAVNQFVADCTRAKHQQTVEFYLSDAALLVSLLEKCRRIDYPSRLDLFAEDDYLDAHTGTSGAAVCDAYRESLALVETTDAGVYLLAMQECNGLVRRIFNSSKS